MTSYTVGIPVRNEQNTLVDCVNSILHQTQKPDQILICVNGSTDNTHYIADEISKKNKTVSLITSEPGKPNAWNEITEQSRNNEIMMIDGDALINNQAAKNLYQTLSKNKKTLISSGKISFTKPSKETLFSKIFTENYSTPIDINFLSGSIYMMKKNELIKYAKSMEINLMPTNIISEDGLLDYLTRTNNSRKQAENAYSTIIPIGNFNDWLLETFRIQKGKKQLEEKYPKLQPIENRVLRRKNRLNRLKKLTPQKKISFIGKYGIYCAIGLCIKWTKSDYDILWKETTSTKQTLKI